MSTTTASTSVKVTFYNTNGTLNTDYSGRIIDNRSSVSLFLDGDSDDVSSTTLYVDSAVATSGSRRQISCQMGTTTTVEQGTYSKLAKKYSFVNKNPYSLRCRIFLKDNTTLDAKFSISGATPTPSYNYLYTTDINTFSSATIVNPAQIENGSSITVDAPFDLTTNTNDTRKPKDVILTFEVVEQEGDADNLEALYSYSAVKPYNDGGIYTLENNELTNGQLYAVSVKAVFSDGFEVSENVTDFIALVESPVISLVSAYGLGLDYTGAGVPEISSVMDVTMETHADVTSGEKITFKLSQGATVYYTYEVNAQTGTNPTYYITYSDLVSTNSLSVPTSTTDVNGNEYFAFDVTAVRSYGNLDKESEIYTANFKLDITPVIAVSVYNHWTALGLVGSSRTVTLDSELTQANFDLISETGYAAKFPKTAFFGTGKTGLYADLDTTSTKFKVEASVNGGLTFAPVTSLRMKQGTVASSAAEDRLQWLNLLDEDPTTNAGGLYDNFPWSTVLVGTSQPPIYLLADCDENASLVLRVSIVAERATLPDGTESSVVEIMNKVNTPVAQAAYYSILNNKLYVVVDNSFDSSNDTLTGVSFTSNLASPNDDLVVPLPAGNTTNQFTFEVASPDPELRGTAHPVLFQIAHMVNDDNGGADIAGLKGPETSVVCYNAPTRENFTVTVSDTNLKTVSQHGVSSVEFSFTMNTDNNSVIYGLRVYFNVDGGSSILVDEIVRAAVSPREIILSDKTFYSEWEDRTVGTLTFVPLFYDTNANGITLLHEASSETRGIRLYKAENLPAITAPMLKVKGGILEKDTILQWTSYEAYDDVLTEGAADLSEDVVLSPPESSYTMANDTLIAGVEKILSIMRSVTLSAVSATTYVAGLDARTLFGPTTTVKFTPASINVSTMTISVLQGSDDDVLVTSFAAHEKYGDDGQLNIEAIQLGKEVDDVFSTLTFVADSVGTSTSALQTAAESNEHNIESETLSTLLDLKVRVTASVDYTVEVGDADPIGEVSESVTLLGPSKSYRVAGSPSASSNSSSYTVINDEVVTIPLSINANGMDPEGLSNAFAFITQAGDFTDPSSDGVGATVFCLWSVHSPRTYAVGTDAVSSNTSDNKLAPGETATTTPMDLVNGVNAVEVGSYSLTLGNLTSSDSSSISFPLTGFDPSKEIGVTFVAQTRVGYTFIPFIVSPSSL